MTAAVGEREDEAQLRVARFLALTSGGFALVGLAIFPVGDWVYDEWQLPVGATLSVVAAPLAWLVALGLSFVERAPRTVVALGATPVVLLAAWLIFLD